jgi:DNA-binding LacI/PurR family transcriptional regulator
MCGVSRTTVSAVLNGKRNVRESTRSKILECVRAQNYDSGMVSPLLVGELSHMVAVLATDLTNPFSLSVFRGIDQVLGGQGYHILFHKVRRKADGDPEMLASLQSCRPAGYIVLQGAEGRDSEYVRSITAEGVPLVALEVDGGGGSHSVRFKKRAAIGLATDYVIGCGHRRIGHLAGPAGTAGARERQMGFVESLITHDVHVSDSIIIDAGETATEGYAAALELLKDPAKRPTAVVCFNDMVALGVYRAAHELSIDIPRDLSVTGFDGLEFTELLGPALTTVDIHAEQLGVRMAELLLKVIRGEVGAEPVTEWVEPTLVVRESVLKL